jgi:hypothetical protein
MDRQANLERSSLMETRVDQNGYPLNPQSLFIGVRRVYVPNEVALTEHATKGLILSLPCRFLGEWKSLNLFIKKITIFPNGKVISGRPAGGLLANWPEITLWVPTFGSCGVLR